MFNMDLGLGGPGGRHSRHWHAHAWGAHGRHHHGFGFRGGRGSAGDPTLAILDVLAEESPLSGGKLVEALEKRDDWFAPDPTVFYPALQWLEDLGHVAVLRASPCSAHAKATGTRVLGGSCPRHHGLGAHQFLGLHAGVMPRRLGAVGAVFRASSRLDRQQGRDLHRIGIVVRPVRGVGLRQQVIERQVKQRAHLRARPVSTH